MLPGSAENREAQETVQVTQTGAVREKISALYQEAVRGTKQIAVRKGKEAERAKNEAGSAVQLMMD